MKLNVRSAAEVIADVGTWAVRLGQMGADLTAEELHRLAGDVSLFGVQFEALERAVQRRRQERAETDARAVGLALKAQGGKQSKGPGRQPGAPHEPLTHTGPHPEGSYAPRT